MFYHILLWTWLLQDTEGQYSGQGYSSVPALPDLTEVDLSDNNIADIGSDFSGVTALEILHLSRNSFTVFPDFTLTPVYGKFCTHLYYTGCAKKKDILNI